MSIASNLARRTLRSSVYCVRLPVWVVIKDQPEKQKTVTRLVNKTEPRDYSYYETPTIARVTATALTRRIADSSELPAFLRKQAD